MSEQIQNYLEQVYAPLKVEEAVKKLLLHDGPLCDSRCCGCEP